MSAVKTLGHASDLPPLLPKHYKLLMSIKVLMGDIKEAALLLEYCFWENNSLFHKHTFYIYTYDNCQNIYLHFVVVLNDSFDIDIFLFEFKLVSLIVTY